MDRKKQVHDFVPKRIKELQFGLLSNKDIVQQATAELSDRNVYESVNNGPERLITENGPMDERMGTSSKVKRCRTCAKELSKCNGHYGYIKLALPAFHIGFVKRIIEILQCICKYCSRILLPDDRRRYFLGRIRIQTLEYIQREAICKTIVKECRSWKNCAYCGALNGTVRKVPSQALKIVHDKFSFFTKSNAKYKVVPPSKLVFDASFDEAKKSILELERHMKRAMDDMNPLRVLKLFHNVEDYDCELLGFRPGEGRPEMLLWEYVPAAPVTIRPSVAQEMATTEDDITNKIGDIIEINNYIQTGLVKGQTLQTIIEQWDHLQLLLALCINSEAPGLQQISTGKFIRGFCQRLKGKQGRFRGNLSGKRVDFSARTVISPDPNLKIDEVAIPLRVAVKMTYPERVTCYNKTSLQECIQRGRKHPGASYIIKNGSKRKVSLEISQRINKLDKEAKELQIGDVVERHLSDGDIVLFNRQPSLHKLSIMSHRAKIRPFRTFRLNECVCTPYNADFDGDEMNLHVLQSEEARAEAIELMGVKHNLATPKNGAPIIAAIQDFIAAAYLLSHKDNFIDRSTFAMICGYMFDHDLDKDLCTAKVKDLELPPPTIWKPQRLWTGKQVWNILLRPHEQSEVLVNLDVPCKMFKSSPGLPPDLNEDDSWLIIRNSEVMCGVMDKLTVGDGNKNSVFYTILRDFGPDYAAQAMSRLARLSARWLTDCGFSIGISDVYPSDNLLQRKETLVMEAYRKCEVLSIDLDKKCLIRDAGCDQKLTFENKCTGILNAVRQEAGAICLEQLGRWNAPSLMARCGAKGSNINVAQMVAAVGQQTISNKRIDNGFQDRTLPHFAKASRQPLARGFVQNSFFSGLTPTEFLFHAMTGREGLVDTAVKTAETGYMSRRLMKSLEDLSAQYDDTVRNSSKSVVQFQYGDDRLDPIDMEAKAKPVHFERTFTHAVSTTWNNTDAHLSPAEIRRLTRERLGKERRRLGRISLLGDTLPYNDTSDSGIDGKESARAFLDTLEDFIMSRANKINNTRTSGSLHGYSQGRNQDVRDKILKSFMDYKIKISHHALEIFIEKCLGKYKKSLVQPGHAVGAVGAQSIGEPGTQMTLKTFHFAGVAGMSITQGVPRIKEIINASIHISTPFISCALLNKEHEQVARIVKGRIEKTYLRDIISYIDDVWHPDGAYLSMKVDAKIIDNLQLEVNMEDIEKAIMKMKGFKRDVDHIRYYHNRVKVIVGEPEERKKRAHTKISEEHFLRVQSMKRSIPNIVIKGYPDAHRAIIKKDDKPNRKGVEEFALLVEGYGLKDCMTTDGVNGCATRTNSVMEMRCVLGIEAARKTIINEIRIVMGQMDIDPRHMALLADVMTYKGEVLGITRFGLAKMRDSVLQLASFEKTPDHLFEAASRVKKDRIEGVSECIIMGQSMHLGTGTFKVVRQLAFEHGDLQKNEALFETCCAAL